jgi:hypothetical protein
MTSAAQRLILRGGRSAALGFLIRLAARLFFVFIAGRLFGVALFGAFSIAVAVVELAVTIGGAGMKRQLFKLLDEGHHLRSPPHILVDGIVLVFAASFLCAAPIMLAVALAPASLIAGNTATALFWLEPMILGQSLLDLLLAATRWTHKMRHQVWARSIIEPYAGVAASWIAWAAGYQATGLIIGYWAGTIAAVWLELDGSPTHHVVIFQANAAISAQSIVVVVTTFVSTKPLPMVDATAPPKSAPVKLNTAAIAIACRGVRTFVETTVAIAFAAS